MCEDMDTPPPAKRLRISELNPHLLCALCGGYLIDATTIIECLHSFCKTCIVKYLETSKYCPICEVLIHKTRPWQNIRLDHALQNAVYKMVPGLFQQEMKRRREFYEKCNNEDKQVGKGVQHQCVLGSRIIFSHDEEFSISIEFSPNGKPVPEVSNKNLKRQNNNSPHDKRYLKCPAGLRVSHLKKFIRSKFSLPRHILIDLFYSQEPLSDSFSLMDIAYIYLWKRDCVLQLFYSFFQKPVKRQPVETITKTVAEKVKEKHEVKGRERERAEREKVDQSKASVKKDKEKGKDTKQGKISGKKEVLYLAGSDSSQSLDKPDNGRHPYAPSKRKSGSSEFQSLSSPSPEKKQKKPSPMNKVPPFSKAQAVSSTQTNLKVTNLPLQANCSKTETHYQSLSSTACVVSKNLSPTSVTLSNKANKSSPFKTHCSSVNGRLSSPQSDVPGDHSVSSSSQKIKRQTYTAVSDIYHNSVSDGEISATSNQGEQTKDANFTPHYPMESSLSPASSCEISSRATENESQDTAPGDISQFSSRLKLVTSTMAGTNNPASINAPSNLLNTANTSLSSNCIPDNLSTSVTVSRSFGQNHTVSVQNTNARYSTSLLDSKTVKSKLHEGTPVNANGTKLDRRTSPIPPQNAKSLPVSGHTLPSSQTLKGSRQNSPMAVVNTELRHESSSVFLHKIKPLNPNVPATCTNTKLYSSNSNTNTASKTTPCALTVISAPVKQTLNLSNVSAEAKMNTGSSCPSAITFNRSTNPGRRKPIQPMPPAQSASPSTFQTPSLGGKDITNACGNDVDVAEEDQDVSPSQSNLFERMDLLSKVADSDTKLEDRRDSASMEISPKEDQHLESHDGQSPTNICQLSPAEKSPGCDDVELLSVEFIDSPKKSSDQSRCDDSVQSLKSDDSGVATTIEIEDDSIDLSQKGQSPVMSTSPSPGPCQPSPLDNITDSNHLNSGVADSDKSRGSPSREPNGGDKASSRVSCSHVIYNNTTASSPTQYSKPGTLFINSACQTTETGSMTIESSLMFASRVSPINEHRTMLRIPKDYTIQPTDLSSKSGKNGTSSSPDSESKLTLCLPVSHLGKLPTKQSSSTINEPSSKSVAHTDTSSSSSVGTSNLQSRAPLSSSTSAIPNALSCVSSIVRSEAQGIRTPSHESPTVSSGSATVDKQTLVKMGTSTTPGGSNPPKSKESAPTQIKTTLSIPERVIPKLTISNDSGKSASVSRKISSSESTLDKTAKVSNLGMEKNVVSSTKSTQPLKLTVTLSNSDNPIKMSPTPKEPKKHDHPTSVLNQPPKTMSQSSKSHTVARIIATSSSQSPSPPPVASKLNNNIIQTTKISTLIPKSSSISSKANSFSKQFAYPSNINNVPSSRSFLPSALSHLSRADMVGLINGSASFQTSVEKNSVLTSFSSSTSVPSNSSHHHHHHHKASSSKQKDGTDGRLDKPSKTKTIPPLSIPKSCLISPPLKLQRSPGSTDHYIFTHQNPYLTTTATNHNSHERQRSKESKHNGNRTTTSPPSSTKNGSFAGERQRVPSIKISDINRNPIIVESGQKVNNSGNTSHGQSTNHRHRSHNHGNSRSENGSNRHRVGNSAHSPDLPGPSSSSSSRSAITKEHRRPSDSEILISTPWHLHSAGAEFMFHHPFKIPTASKFHNLHYDTDAMPLDYSQSSSKL